MWILGCENIYLLILYWFLGRIYLSRIAQYTTRVWHGSNSVAYHCFPLTNTSRKQTTRLFIFPYLTELSYILSISAAADSQYPYLKICQLQHRIPVRCYAINYSTQMFFDWCWFKFTQTHFSRAWIWYFLTFLWFHFAHMYSTDMLFQVHALQIFVWKWNEKHNANVFVSHMFWYSRIHNVG